MTARERNLVLNEPTVSAAAERVTELAAQMQYEAVPSAPRTYRLRRKRRRRLLGTVVETMTIALVEDRSGVKARLTGDLDDLFVQHLGGVDVVDAITPPPTGSGVAEIASPPPPPTTSPSVERSDRRVRPSTVPGGMIAAVPGGSPRRPAESQDPRPTVPRRMVERSIPDDGSSAPEHTVMRSPQRPTPVLAATHAAVLPDGRRVDLDTVLLIGRSPDQSMVDRDTVGVVVDDRSISKTHATIEIEGERLVVTDLHSSNGSWIDVDGRSIECEPGTATSVTLAGCTVRCGDAPIRIEVAR